MFMKNVLFAVAVSLALCASNAMAQAVEPLGLKVTLEQANKAQREAARKAARIEAENKANRPCVVLTVVGDNVGSIGAAEYAVAKTHSADRHECVNN